ncbi:hypothetical protein RYH73_14890 [Olivibacter sp. CPCC 100613]|uniref:hypothetical protein n=1 Tax=Olivibacter sp. CPCC 100613 TaxID=3079931 RepID=UPI002FF5777B
MGLKKHLIGLGLILGCFSASSQIRNIKTALPNVNVGDIFYIPFLDDPLFKVYNKSSLPQYYQVDGGYKGGRTQILTEFNRLIGKQIPADSDGFITIRFIVNKDGKTGRLRVFEIGSNYNQHLFNFFLVERLLSFTKQLKCWKVAELKGVKTDYYQYLTFVIRDKKIVDILP